MIVARLRSLVLISCLVSACTTKQITGLEFPPGDTGPTGALAFWVTFEGDRLARASPAFDPHDPKNAREFLVTPGETVVALVIDREDLYLVEPRIDDDRILHATLLPEPNADIPVYDTATRRVHFAVPERAIYRLEGRGTDANLQQLEPLDPLAAALASAELLLEIDPDPCVLPARRLEPYLADPDELRRYAEARNGDGSIGSVAVIDRDSALVSMVEGLFLVRRGRSLGTRITSDTEPGDLLPLGTVLGGFETGLTRAFVDPRPLPDGRSRVWIAANGTREGRSYPIIHEVHAGAEGIEWKRVLQGPRGAGLISMTVGPNGELAAAAFDGQLFVWDGGERLVPAFGHMQKSSFDWRLLFTGDPQQPLLITDQDRFGYVDASSALVIDPIAESLADVLFFDGEIYGVGRDGVVVVRRDRVWVPQPVYYPQRALGCALGNFPALTYSKTLRRAVVLDEDAYIVAQECSAIFRLRAPARGRAAACISPITPPEGAVYVDSAELNTLDARDGVIVAGGQHGLLVASFPDDSL